MRALIINGPNLNKLGQRNKYQYGTKTLEDIYQLIIDSFEAIEFDFYQSNHEGSIIDLLQNLDNYDFVVINPGGLAHTSVILRDAFELVSIPKGVCHLSDIQSREYFRRVDYLKPLADCYVSGLKEQSYLKVIEALINKFFTNWVFMI